MRRHTEGSDMATPGPDDTSRPSNPPEVSSRSSLTGELDDILRHMYETAVQDADGTRVGRKGYRLRHEEVPERVRAAVLAALAAAIEQAAPEKPKMFEDFGRYTDLASKVWQGAIDDYRQRLLGIVKP